jgi:hypothetical protein
MAIFEGNCCLKLKMWMATFSFIATTFLIQQ